MKKDKIFQVGPKQIYKKSLLWKLKTCQSSKQNPKLLKVLYFFLGKLQTIENTMRLS